MLLLQLPPSPPPNFLVSTMSLISEHTLCATTHANDTLERRSARVMRAIKNMQIKGKPPWAAAHVIPASFRAETDTAQRLDMCTARNNGAMPLNHRQAAHPLLHTRIACFCCVFYTRDANVACRGVYCISVMRIRHYGIAAATTRGRFPNNTDPHAHTHTRRK